MWGRPLRSAYFRNRCDKIHLIADLHLHSNYSDGELSPSALVDVVADAGVELMALTDHDTTAGHDEAQLQCDRRGIRLTRGIELTSYAMGRVIHVLGLGVRSDDDGLSRAGEIARANFAQNQQRWVDDLTAHGADVLWKRDFPEGAARLPVLIERLCGRGVEGGDPRRVHAAFRAYFRALPEESYAPLPSPRIAADVIHRAGGLAILAHPYRIADDDSWHTLLDGMDGIEAMYANYQPAQRQSLLSIARTRELLTSCGSDYHGYFFGKYANPGFEASPALLARLGVE
jgi:predicted metal-dependent phosphoesterase TrpH